MKGYRLNLDAFKIKPPENMYYKLEDKKVVPVNSYEEMNNLWQRVALTEFYPHIKISTVFLGINHRWTDVDTKPPIVFETMIFNGKHDEYQERYETYEQAVEGHKKAVAMARKDLTFYQKLLLFLFGMKLE